MRRPSSEADRRGRAVRRLLLVPILCAMAAVAWVLARDRGADTPPPTAAPMLALGRQALDGPLFHPGSDGEVVRFRLNGAPVSAVADESEGTMAAILGEARARCVAEAPNDPGALVDALRSPPERATADGPPLVLGSMAIAHGQGFVACLDRVAEPPMRGALRYVYARDAPVARFVVVWTRSLLTFDDLARVDEAGDVVGEDVPGLPRPEGARRRSSFVRVDGTAHLVVYDVPATPAAMQRWAEAELPRAGWSGVRASRGAEASRVLRAQRGRRSVYIVAQPDHRMVVVAGSDAPGYGEPHSPSP